MGLRHPTDLTARRLLTPSAAFSASCMRVVFLVAFRPHALNAQPDVKRELRLGSTVNQRHNFRPTPLALEPARCSGRVPAIIAASQKSSCFYDTFRSRCRVDPPLKMQMYTIRPFNLDDKLAPLTDAALPLGPHVVATSQSTHAQRLCQTPLTSFAALLSCKSVRYWTKCRSSLR